MALAIRIKPGRKYHIKHNGSVTTAALEVRRSVTRPNQWLIVLHDERMHFDLSRTPYDVNGARTTKAVAR